MARFATLSELEINDILDDKLSKNTKRATASTWLVLLTYMTEKQMHIDFSKASPEEINEVLRKFYVEVRQRQNGKLYRLQTFKCLRGGIMRKIKELRPDINIVEDNEFTICNNVFSAQCVLLKKRGLGKVDHKDPISPADMKALYQSQVFDCKSPRSLQRKVFFDIMFFLCRRGQENLRELKISDFAVGRTEDGRECVQKVSDELTKNHREDNEAQDGGIIITTDFTDCPVKSFKKYVAVLNPKLDDFFQRPRKQPSSKGLWYDAQVVGVATLSRMMKEISQEANLSKVYTNHCIRATSVTVLDNCGIEARHIMSVSGHRSENSIRSYSRTGVGMKRKMFSELANYCRQSNDVGRSSAPNLQEPVESASSSKKPLPIIPPFAKKSMELRDDCAVKKQTFDFGLGDMFDDIDDDTLSSVVTQPATTSPKPQYRQQVQQQQQTLHCRTDFATRCNHSSVMPKTYRSMVVHFI